MRRSTHFLSVAQRCARSTRLVAQGCLLSVLLCTGACRTEPYVWVHHLPPEKKSPFPPGTIAPGDVLEIKVYGEESLTTRARVRNDGVVTVPLLGPVPVFGNTPPALAAALEARLKPYYPDPRVTVVVLESEITVTVVGEVKQVGVLALQAPASVLQALAKTGGPTEFADRSKIFVIRNEGSTAQRVRFSYDALLAGDPAALAFRLKAGDVVVVE